MQLSVHAYESREMPHFSDGDTRIPHRNRYLVAQARFDQRREVYPTMTIGRRVEEAAGHGDKPINMQTPGETRKSGDESFHQVFSNCA